MKTSQIIWIIILSIVSQVQSYCGTYTNHHDSTLDYGKTEPIPEIFWPSFLNTKLTISKLSSIADNISYVKLTTPENIVVGNIRAIELGQKMILIYDQTSTVFLFSGDGKLITHLNRSGRGPEEYSNIVDLALDYLNKRIAIASDNDKKINLYDFNGKFIKDIKLLASPEAIQYLTGDLFLIKLSPYSQRENTDILSSIVINSKGDIIQKHKYYVKEKSGPSILIRFYGSINHSGEGPIIYEPFNDTIYSVNRNGLRRPYIINNLGKYKAPREAYEGTNFFQKYSSQYFSQPLIYSTSDYILTTFRYNRLSYNGLYDLKTNQAILFENKDHQYKLTDDIDFGLPFINARTVNEYLIMDILEPSKLANDKTIKPRKNSEFEQIMINMHENDNPIIRIIKTKKIINLTDN